MKINKNNTDPNTNNNTNKPNTNNNMSEGTIPEIDRKQELAELEKLRELSNQTLPIDLEETGSSNPSSTILEAVEKLQNERLAALKSLKYQEKPAEEEEDNLI
jgi:hypothetical protein